MLRGATQTPQASLNWGGWMGCRKGWGPLCSLPSGYGMPCAPVLASPLSPCRLHHCACSIVVNSPSHPLVSTADNPKPGSWWQGGLWAGTIVLPSSVTPHIPHPCPPRVNPVEAGCLRALVPVQK